MAYTMKEVTEKMNMTSYTLRYYEQEGLLKDVKRDSIGRRIYEEDHLQWLEFIYHLRETGMPVSKIKSYIDLYAQGDSTFKERKAMMIEHKKKVQQQLDEYIKHLEVISYKVAMYDLQEKEMIEKL
jgi:DNA-binding transcriptional MerR regulator